MLLGDGWLHYGNAFNAKQFHFSPTGINDKLVQKIPNKEHTYWHNAFVN